MTPQSSAAVSALDTSQVKNLSIVAIVAVLVIGVIISWLVTKIVTRIIAIVLAVVLAFALYSQRATVVDKLDKAAKNCDVTFFGVHVQPSNSNVKAACNQLAEQGKK
ncbi:MAG TPA: hypothetical protein VGH11_17485 [Jatrophihabitans sp.]|jgi:hypothetical protein